MPHYLHLGPDLLPQLDQLPQSALRSGRMRVLLLNYPNNPTSAVATREFFQRAVDLCREHGLLLIHDNPYVDLVGLSWASGGCGVMALLRYPLLRD